MYLEFLRLPEDRIYDYLASQAMGELRDTGGAALRSFVIELDAGHIGRCEERRLGVAPTATVTDCDRDGALLRTMLADGVDDAQCPGRSRGLRIDAVAWVCGVTLALAPVAPEPDDAQVLAAMHWPLFRAKAVPALLVSVHTRDGSRMGLTCCGPRRARHVLPAPHWPIEQVQRLFRIHLSTHAATTTGATR